MKASIIISDLESKGLMPLVVHILCHQTLPKDQYEVIFPQIHDPSPEEETILLNFQSHYPHLTLLPPEKNRAKALNHAASLAKGKWILFAESHCVMLDNWAESWINFLNASPYECALGLIQQLSSREMISQSEARNKKSSVDYLSPSFLDLHNSAILKTRFDQMGGFFEKLPILAEFELGARLHRQGLTIGRFSEQKVLHKNTNDFAVFLTNCKTNGADRMRVIQHRGPDFARAYFPNPFIRFAKYIKPIRPAFLLAAHLLIAVTKTGYFFSWLFNLQRPGYYFFRWTSKNVHRLGYLEAMKK